MEPAKQTPLEELVAWMQGGVIEKAELQGDKMILNVRHGEGVQAVYSHGSFSLESKDLIKNLKEVLNAGVGGSWVVHSRGSERYVPYDIANKCYQAVCNALNLLEAV